MTSVKSKLFAVKKNAPHRSGCGALESADDGRGNRRRAGSVFGGGGRWRASFWRWWPMGEATAEGRLYNRSPRLACLPGVGCRMRDLPPKSGCINYLQGGGCGFYNRSSAVDANGLMSRGRQANPVLTYETALRRFFASRRWRKPMMRAVDANGLVAIRKISKLCANSICSFWEY